ncbi:fumarylacetoacetate hydrolase family protein [Akkermansiaceae bacterium]|nr:fumarylacetoacetate hydrolase family protein [Akkermansiaceae bacterium]
MPIPDFTTMPLPAIYGIGLNYLSHAREVNKPTPGHPMVFMKPPAAATRHGEPIVLPRHLRSDKVDYEGELAVIIGRSCKNVSASEAISHIAGYTLAIDVSARDWQFDLGGGQFCKGKGFDSFCPLGPVLRTPEEIPDPQGLEIRTFLNGELVQRSRTEMIFPVMELIAFLSGSTTLEAGTVILTGTPSGVGHQQNPPRYLRGGDRIVVEIPEIGRLIRDVVEERLDPST